MKSFSKKLCGIVSTIAFMLGGCSATSTEDYASRTPVLDIREYLNGPLEAVGILYDFNGKADVSFRVKMVGSWQGNRGTLKEDFVFSDGRTDQRTWTIQFSDNHHFTATAHDVIGSATGTQHGNAVNMRYMLDAKRANGDTIALSMDDWLYRVDETTVINRTSMRKFGLQVGELVITFRKL